MNRKLEERWSLGPDDEFVGLVRTYQLASQELVAAKYDAERAQAAYDEAAEEEVKSRMGVWNRINGGYPVVVPYGNEGKGTLYYINKDTAALETMDVIISSVKVW